MTAIQRSAFAASFAIGLILWSSTRAGGQTLEESPAGDVQRFVTVGTLVERGMTRSGAPRYALLDAEGQIQSFVAARHGIDLRRFSGRQVGVTARAVSLKTETPYVLAEQVTLLEADPASGAASKVRPAVSSVLAHVSDSHVAMADYQEPMLLDDFGIPEPFEDYRPAVPAAAAPAMMPGTCPQCGYGPGLPDVMPSASYACGACPCGPPGRIYGRAEFLFWWTRGMSVPPLVTTSPPGTPRASAGILGRPTTSILFGDENILTDLHSGGRFRLGAWLDGCQWIGLEAEYAFLSDESEQFSFSSTGTPILARPFFNILTNAQDAQLVAFPNVVSGSITIGASSEFHTASPRLRLNLCCQDLTGRATPGMPFYGFRVDLLGGYRYARLRESLSIRDQTTTIPNGGGTTVVFTDARDVFGTENEFHGGEVGLLWEGYRGPWALELIGRLGIGNVQRQVTISGQTVTTANGVSVTNPGGLLALSSNMGTYEDNSFGLLPELNVTLGYAVTERLRVNAGYTLLYLLDVARPGDQIDQRLNPNLFPPELPNPGVERPTFVLHETAYWAQGLSVGVDYRW